MSPLKTLVIVCTALVVVTMSCSTSGSTTPLPDPIDIHAVNFSDTTYPVLEIYAPAENQVFANGDTIKIDGKVTDNSLYRGSIRITNDATGAILKDQAYEIHGLGLYNFHLEQKATVSVITNYTVSVQFEDHGRNNNYKAVKIIVNP